MRLLIFIAGAAILAGCDPGPLPRVAEPPSGEVKGAFPTSSPENPLPLDAAIMTGDLDEVRALLERKADPNLRWERQGDRLPIQAVLESPIYHYPIADRAEFLRLLLQYGADPNAKWCPFESRAVWDSGLPRCTADTARTALHLAAFYGDRELVTLLLDAGADATWRDWSGASALDYTDNEIVFELISKALFPDLATRDQKALSWLNDYDGSPYGHTPWRATPISRALSQDGGAILAPPPPGETAWSQDRALSRLRTLLRIGADPNERVTLAGFDWPPLAIALSTRQHRAAALLLENGADINARVCTRRSARNFRLIGVTIDPACTHANGITQLMEHARIDDRVSVELLLEFKADRSLKDWMGRTALDYAADPDIRNLLVGAKQ